ncbi:MAG: GNAT family N-acetyltransferase [Bacteroidales bacterium]|jgi:predicted acetyltransferase|nr:GNAT family N-acetyltransferase [Bacteroidales bacterium]
MIVFADNRQKQEVINIWKTSFADDSQEFLDLYFKKKYKKENTLLYLMGKKVVSCLQMLPYEMTFGDSICKTSYISGAATLPEHKNKGIMGQLLTQAFTEMRRRGDDFTTLIPQENWLTAFYRKYGYTSCFEYGLTPVAMDFTVENNDFTLAEINRTNSKKAFDYYSQYCKKQNLFVLKTYKDFLIIWEELQLFGGSIFVCFRQDTVCGIAFCSPNKEKLIIKDLIAKEETIQKQLLLTIGEKYAGKEIFLFRQADNSKEAATLGMARILHGENVLKKYAACFPHLEIALQLTDRHIPENNGVFRLSQGKCIPLEKNNIYNLSVDISLLTQLVLGYQTDKLPLEYQMFPQRHPYMSLMLD